jgi:hypothetical protein
VADHVGSVLTCIAWGTIEQAGSPEGCPVVIESEADHRRYPQGPAPAAYPAVCPCDCSDCGRAWWADGRPVVREGRVIRSIGHRLCAWLACLALGHLRRPGSTDCLACGRKMNTARGALLEEVGDDPVVGS